MVKVAKSVTVGTVYATQVGTVMNTAVGMIQAEEVGIKKTTMVGKSYNISTGDSFTLTVGSSSLTLNQDGTIILQGIDIQIIGSTKVDIIGKDVNINPEGVGGASGGDDEQFMACNADEQEGCEWLGSDDDTFGLSQEQLNKHPNLTKRLQSEERFLGEKTAMKYLIEADNDASLAWTRIRQHRDSYKGVRQTDRNAEHYLYALYDIRDRKAAIDVGFTYSSYQFVRTPGYEIAKATANGVGKASEFMVGKNISPFSKDNPATFDEYLAGFFGAEDALYGIR